MAVDFVKSDGGKDKPKQSGYDIEYTNPTGENASAAKPKHGNLLGFFQKAKPNPYSQPAGSIHPARNASASVAGGELPQQPKAAALPERKLPLAPPPPPPVGSIRELPQQPQPAKAAIQSATALAHHATSVGQVIAQNVTSMRGAITDPAASHPSVVDLNLLPSALHKSLHQASAIFRLFRLTTLTVMALIVVYLTMVCYQAFFVWQSHTALTELDTLDRTILSYRTLQTDINTTSDVLITIQDLLNQHIYWTQWFAFLERHTLSTVYYSNFSGSSTGVMNLEATAPDFGTIAQQLAVLQALPEVQTVEVSTATRSGEATVHFTISLTVDPAVLHYQPRGIYGE